MTSLAIWLEKCVVSKALSDHAQVIRRSDRKAFAADGALSRNRQSRQLSRAAT